MTDEKLNQLLEKIAKLEAAKGTAPRKKNEVDVKALQADPINELKRLGVDPTAVVKHQLRETLGDLAGTDLKDYVTMARMDYAQSRLDALMAEESPSSQPRPEKPRELSEPPPTYEALKAAVVEQHNAKHAKRFAAEKLASHRASEASHERTAGKKWAELRREVLSKHDPEYRDLVAAEDE